GPGAVSFEQLLREYGRSDQAPDAGIGLGMARTGAGDLPGAALAYQEVQVRYPSPDRDGEVERLLTDLRKRGVTVPPPTAAEWYERGKNCYRLAFYDQAHQSFSKALDADPAHPDRADMLLRSGVSLYYLGKRPEAASVLEKLIKAGLPDCRCAEALHWLGKCYSRLGMREEAVETYLKIVSRYPESDWADDALYFAGNVQRDGGDAKQAIKYYRRLITDYPESSFADSALWWMGWIHYSAGEFSKAEESLQELVSRYPRSFLVNQALYWKGRSADRRGERSKAIRSYQRVLAHGPYTYYGSLAAERLSGTEMQVIAAEEPFDAMDPEADDGAEADAGTEDLSAAAGPPDWAAEARDVLSATPAYRRTLELMFQDMKKDAAVELWSLQELRPRRKAALIGLSKTFFQLGDYHSSLLVVLRNFERALERPSASLPGDIWLLAYPQGFWTSISSSARKYGMDPFFVAAIIREESQFRPDALSPAGARGAMQVMPATGEWIARTAGIAGFDRSKLFEADTNISVGTWYLSHLMKRFQGDLTLVSAAYNAGPEAVANWVAKMGAGVESSLFVESIPYTETRGYVKKVLRNYAEYKRLYGSSPALPMSGKRAGQDDRTVICRSEGSCP
ncbi:MAG: tetratricopeptide repeat protein, partial [Nitrospiraceae bacterium]|nr:tetratricopeptide repeat protein [Nitrospiraceae bacterium]